MLIQINQITRGWANYFRTGHGRPITTDEIELFNPGIVPIVRYRYRGHQIPTSCATAA